MARKWMSTVTARGVEMAEDEERKKGGRRNGTELLVREGVGNGKERGG
jgi:hypothetical protein